MKLMLPSVHLVTIIVNSVLPIQVVTNVKNTELVFQIVSVNLIDTTMPEFVIHVITDVMDVLTLLPTVTQVVLVGTELKHQLVTV
jgi:hypothetical protein